jgi:hypothetical protein
MLRHVDNSATSCLFPHCTRLQVVWGRITETLSATDSWVNPTVVPERLDKTPRGGGRRQHLSELVNDDQDIHRHRLATGQGDAAIRSLCRNSNIESDHSERDNSKERCLSSTPYVWTRCAECSARVILAASGCFRRPPNMVLLLFQRISQLARERCSGDSAYGIGVMQNDFCL